MYAYFKDPRGEYRYLGEVRSVPLEFARFESRVRPPRELFGGADESYSTLAVPIKSLACNGDASVRVLMFASRDDFESLERVAR